VPGGKRARRANLSDMPADAKHPSPTKVRILRAAAELIAKQGRPAVHPGPDPCRRAPLGDQRAPDRRAAAAARRAMGLEPERAGLGRLGKARAAAPVNPLRPPVAYKIDVPTAPGPRPGAGIDAPPRTPRRREPPGPRRALSRHPSAAAASRSCPCCARCPPIRLPASVARRPAARSLGMPMGAPRRSGSRGRQGQAPAAGGHGALHRGPGVDRGRYRPAPRLMNGWTKRAERGCR
jgi:hypothetical protein